MLILLRCYEDSSSALAVLPVLLRPILSRECCCDCLPVSLLSLLFAAETCGPKMGFLEISRSVSLSL